jgi:hypothetical protein
MVEAEAVPLKHIPQAGVQTGGNVALEKFVCRRDGRDGDLADLSGEAEIQARHALVRQVQLGDQARSQ